MFSFGLCAVRVWRAGKRLWNRVFGSSPAAQIIPALNVCVHCKKTEDDDKEKHKYERDLSRPEWRGWHAFRRGLATTLHALGENDQTIQNILRHAT